MKAHDKVTIYHDPITEDNPEGEAYLLKLIRLEPDGLERWKVCFEGDDGAVYDRLIKPSYPPITPARASTRAGHQVLTRQAK